MFASILAGYLLSLYKVKRNFLILVVVSDFYLLLELSPPPSPASHPTPVQAVVFQSSCVGHSYLARAGIMSLALPPA